MQAHLKEEREEIVKRRIARVFEQADGSIDGEEMEALFVYNRSGADKNFLYLINAGRGVFENCGVLCDRKGDTYILTSTLEEEILRESGAYTDILVYGSKRERNEALEKVLSPYRKVGICFDTISHALFLDIGGILTGELVDAGPAFRKARMIKDTDELNHLEEACRITSDTADNIPRYLKEGMSEADLALEIDYRIRRSGADGPAFETLVQFGPNTSKPHYSGGCALLQSGDVVLVDFGARFLGYNADVTRTYLTGSPGSEVTHLYKTVLEAQRIALDSIREGVCTESVERQVKDYINGFDRYDGRFIHSLGHSLGLDTHDNGYPGEDFGGVFKTGMVLTVEPGIYLPGFCGVRIEDDIVVEGESCRLLTFAEKEPRAYEI